ncbi:hypothetical protein [Blastopirellula marina]|uniref:Uncharacterized protein n=1 Tax=Blastopirellula marina TaxID=124 RepID=A0A2S8GEQ6_9BACT|nr:hypothetical protein [Blastopirellula marina]PQO42584.1 hypothetical protein C5Y98_01730 [Blastopirellula marina]PTL46350.1 hypothetical protein C5Y97_01730 [Blastopirellula marina]
MTQTTNPYQTWLGLNVSSRPDCYTLLGLPLYEADGGKIMVAAQNAMARASIPMAPADEPARLALVSEIQLAQNCLLDPAQKQAYDQQLQAYFSSQAAAAQAVTSPTATPQTATPQIATPQIAAPQTVVASQRAKFQTAPVASSDSSAEPLIQAKKQSAASSAKQRARNSAFTTYAGLALVLVTALGGGGYYFFVMKPAEDLAQQQADPQPAASPDRPPAKPAASPEKPDEPETPDPSAPAVPGGKRPTSTELANSISGLGNPDEAMESMDAMPSMMNKPPEPTATPEQQAELETALLTAWNGISQRDYAKASIALGEVRQLPKTNEGKARFEQVDQFVQDLLAFNKARNEGIESLAENEELTVGTTKFTVTVVDGDRIVVRVANQNKAFNRQDLPEGFQRALAMSRLKGDNSLKQRIEASYLLLSPKADIEYVRDLWMKSGADGGTLAALEADKKKFAASEMMASAESAAMPEGPGEEMAPPGDGSPLSNLVQTARKQLAQRNPAAAQQALASVDSMTLSPENQAQIAALKQVVDLNAKFWDAVSKRLTKLPADEDLDVNGKLTRVVESDANRLVIRMAGENKRYTLADMPAGLAKFLAEMELPANVETKKIVGAFLLVTPEGGVERAREEWATGFLPQEEVDLLVSAMTSSLDVAAAPSQPAPIPSDAKLAGPADALAKKWNTRIAAAKSASDHIEIGKQLFEAAKSQTAGSPAQFVAFRLALAEGARGADFSLCSSIINDWHASFAISAGEWHFKAMQLAGSSSDSPQVHTAIAQHAITQVPQLRAAGENNIAQAMQKVAQQSAAKAGDNNLIEAVKQLSSDT